MVARLGADEYAILIESVDSALDIEAFAEIINFELAEPRYIDGVGVAVTATIGVVQRQTARTNLEELMRAASATLRCIRGRGTRQGTPFDPHINATDRAKLRLAAAMPGALKTDELQVTYQPVVTWMCYTLWASGCCALLPDTSITQPVSALRDDGPSQTASEATEALMRMVRAEGIDVVAFPVDSAEQAAWWRRIGANWAVGALFGPAGPPDRIEPLLDVLPSSRIWNQV
jgi:Diguanylate cyclase, GGDEF domain